MSLSAPPQKAIDDRATKVAELIKQMGDKYLLYKLYTRKQ